MSKIELSQSEYDAELKRWIKEGTASEERCREVFGEFYSIKDTAKKRAARVAVTPLDTGKGPKRVMINIKEKAIELYKQGLSVATVAGDLGITYANAYYYKKFVK